MKSQAIPTYHIGLANLLEVLRAAFDWLPPYMPLLTLPISRGKIFLEVQDVH